MTWFETTSLSPAARARFEVIEELGAGGFGRVFKARDREHDELVALKVLARRDPQALKRFKSEFRSLTDLVHDNLVSLIEMHQPEEGEHDWFITMQLVEDGRAFTDFLRGDAAQQRHPSVALSRSSLALPAQGAATSSAALHETADAGSAPFSADVGSGLARALRLQTPSALVEPRGADETPDAPASGPTPTPASTPRGALSFHGIEAPDAATRTRWEALRPAPGTGLGVADDGVTLPRLESCFRQLVEALSWLHASGHLHRDVKPSNVLVGADGVVKLVDFGLVSRLAAAPDDVALVGTPAFMAPEVCAGLPASPASDWYSVGVMLYLVLTGHLPFSGDPRDVVLAKQCVAPRPPSELCGVSPHLEELCLALLAVNPTERPGAAALGASFGGGELDGELRYAPDVFVGRAEEVSRLTNMLDPSLESGVRVALISGPSGLGKSALVRHVLRGLAARGDDASLVLQSRCFVQGSVRHRALDGAMDELATHLATLSPEDRAGILPDASGLDALARLFPVLSAFCPERQASAHRDPVDLRRHASQALRDLLGALAARRMLVMVVDDAQWADLDSVGLVSELVRHVPARWIFVFRPEERSTSPFLAALEEDMLPRIPDARVTSLELAPLAENESVALAREVLDQRPDALDTERVTQIARETRGHPLYIAELARSLAAAPSKGHGPDHQGAAATLDGLLSRRLGALPASSRYAVELIAVAGEPLNLRLVRSLAAVDTTELKRLLAGHLILVRSGVDGDQGLCWHDRVRETAVERLSPRERAERHHALAIEADRRGGAEPSFIHSHLFAALEIWLQVPGAIDDEAMLPAALSLCFERGFAAMEAARATLSFTRAASIAGSLRALFAATRAQPGPGAAVDAIVAATFGGEHGLVTAHAESLLNAGRGVEAGRAFERAAALSTDSLERRRQELRAAEQYLFAGAFAEGEATIRNVLGRAGLGVAQGVAGAMTSFIWESLRMKVRGFRFAPTQVAAVKPDHLATIDTLWSATIGLSMAWPLGAQAAQQRHMRHALDAGEPHRIARALSIELAFSGLPGGRDERKSQRLSTLAHEVARGLEDPYPEAFVTMSDGAIHWLRGRWKEAQRAVESALAVYRRECVGVQWEKDTAEFVALSALAHQGDLPALLLRTEDVLGDAIERGDLYLEAQVVTRVSPLLALAQGNAAQALSKVDHALSRWTGSGFQIVHYWALMNRVTAHLYDGRADLAQRELDRQRTPLKRSFMLMGQYYRVQHLELLARAALIDGSAPALARADKLSRALFKEKMPWSDPMAHLVRGLVLARRGPGAHAIESLAGAVKGFDEVDMRLHALAARVALGLATVDAGVVGAAHSELSGLGVVDPERFVASLGVSASKH